MWCHNELSVSVSDAIETLQQAGASMRCRELQKILEALGFEIRDASKEGHKVVTHSGLKNFYSASYTCGHGKDPEVKRNYVRSILRVLKDHRDDLQRLMEERSQ